MDRRLKPAAYPWLRPGVQVTPDMGRILGLDLGEKRIGLALSDPTGLLVVDSWILERRGEPADLESLDLLCQQRQVERLVVGLPRSLEGGLGPQAQLTLGFVARLAQRTGLPVDTWDERLSTVAAERALRESGMRRERRRQHRDAVAAALLLQSYLERSILPSAGGSDTASWPGRKPQAHGG